MIEESLGQPVEQLFLEFDPVPMAAASIGRSIAPSSRTAGRRQGAAARCAAPDRGRPQPHVPGRPACRGASPRARTSSTREGSSTSSRARSGWSSITSLEARNAETFRKNFAGHPHVKVPRVYWTYTRPRVLTLEYVEGTQLADLDTLEYSVEDRRRLAEVLTDTWMTMIFRHGFFHGVPPRQTSSSSRPTRSASSTSVSPVA